MKALKPHVGRLNGVLAFICLSVGLFSHFVGAENIVRRNAARFIKLDTTTQGNWKGIYGTEGYNIVEHAENYPSYVKVFTNERLRNVWSPSTHDVRALLKRDSDNDRFIGRWYRWSRDHWTLTLQFTDDQPHQIAVYCVDWEKAEPRTQKIEVLDTFSRAVLDTQTLSSFSNGKYLVWNLQGTVTLKFSQLEGNDSVMSGLFFDKPAIISSNLATNATATQAPPQ